MKLEWTRFAIEDRNIIFDYIEQDNPAAAVAVDDRISEQVNQLKTFSKSGRPGRVDGTRELIITHTPYIAAYSITGDTGYILRILHGAQLWPDIF
ncbi:MAG: type II toxin-antitoxin system RelE/ParE family toxin [Gammaproteobacteria bacterium]|nr:type II toxin-antitoxin system RelE/ParE family toxin [Gammaproteobacteria bacterium]